MRLTQKQFSLGLLAVPTLIFMVKHLQEVLVSVMTSGPSERILELAHFHGDGGPLNVRILGNPNEINLTMCSRGGVMNIAVTANKGGGK